MPSRTAVLFAVGSNLAVAWAALGCASSSSSIPSQTPTDSREQAIVEVVQELFDALRVRDVDALERIMVENVQLVVVDSAGVRSVSREQFITGLLATNAELEERMWRPDVRIDGSLATLTAPYDFHVDGARTHCGVDVVQLVHDGAAWRVVSIAYTKQIERCADPDAPVVPSRLTSFERRQSVVTPAGAVTGSPDVPRNVILLIADGMGYAALRALRDRRDDPATPGVDATRLDRAFVGTVSTDPAGPPGTITDSAAAATAMATGVVTLNGHVGVDPNGLALPTVLDRAVERGKWAGIVVTSTITHATPAAFVAHHSDRTQEAALADQFVETPINGQPLLRVALGGGQKRFMRDDRDLSVELRALGYDVVTTADELASSQSERLFGLFAPYGLASANARPPEQPSLPSMTDAALQRLAAAPEGFFLLVEASQVDWAAHDNDVVTMLAELDELAVTADRLFDFAAGRDDTLLVITADHETGGFSTGANAVRQWHVARASTVTQMPETLRDRIVAGEAPHQVMQSGAGIAIEPATAVALRRVARSGASDASERVLKLVLATIDAHVGVGWTTTDHTATDVPLMGAGPGIERLRGSLRNTDLARVLFELFGDAPS